MPLVVVASAPGSRALRPSPPRPHDGEAKAQGDVAVNSRSGTPDFVVGKFHRGMEANEKWSDPVFFFEFFMNSESSGSLCPGEKLPTGIKEMKRYYQPEIPTPSDTKCKSVHSQNQLITPHVVNKLGYAPMRRAQL